MSRVYIRYISLWNQTDSKSYISVNWIQLRNKTLYNKIHRTAIVTIALQCDAVSLGE